MKSPEISELKQNTSLKSLFEAHGVTLVKKGRSFFGLCPFHPDKNPSLVVNEHEGLWHCMGCDAGGDAVTAIEKLDKLGFKEAVQVLRGLAVGNMAGMPALSPRIMSEQPDAMRSTPVLEPVPFPPTAVLRSADMQSADMQSAEPKDLQPSNRQTSNEQADMELLAQVSEFYSRTLGKSQEGRTYLGRRGFRDEEILKKAGAGFVDGTLLPALPRGSESLERLQGLGILNGKGHESFLGCITFPLRDTQGRITGIYGRRIIDGEVRHQYMRGPRKGVWYDHSLNRRAVICECVIDALSVIQAGIPGAVACHGTNGFTEEHEALLKARGVQEAVVIFDGDDAGRRGAAKVKDRLLAMGIAVDTKDLPEGIDLNDLLAKEGPEAVIKLVGVPSPGPVFRETPECLIYESSDRRYEIKGIKHEDGHIRATIKAVSGTRFHVDSLDLVQAKQRASFTAEAATLYGADRRVIAGELLQILGRIEGIKTGEDKDCRPEITAMDREEAESFLADPDLLGQIAQDMEALGLVGEEANKQLTYLIALSRRLASPLSAIIMSRSSAGKSTLLDKVLELTPPEEQVRYTRLSSQALFYKGKDSLKHKVMVIEEQTGATGADYALRSMQSAKRLTMAVTVKDPATGMLKTVDYEVEGPVAVMISTTDAAIHHENETRAFCICVDESREQTRRIHELQRRSRSLPGMIRDLGKNRLKAKHHNAQRLLAPVKVVNPYVEYLRFPDRQLRTRREHEKYLTLIETITYLYQRQRGLRDVTTPGGIVQMVETVPVDILAANGLMKFVLEQTLSELSGPTLELLGEIRGMVVERSGKEGIPEGEVQFSRRDIREHTGWSDWQVKTHIQRLEELEYICPVHGQRGKKYVYELGWRGELADMCGEGGLLVTGPELLEIERRLKGE